MTAAKKTWFFPTLTTNSITAITINSATSGGNITASGGANITARGICYGTVSSPDISGTSTSDGTGPGSFTSNMTGLTPNTLYYVRAYATNKVGTAYGSEVTFTTTAIVVPTLTTTAVTGVTLTEAVSGGNITADGGGAVSARGVCWATTTGPTITNSLTSDGTGTGSFASNLSSLVPATTYYLRAYATNSAGTAYGNEVTFTTVLNAPTNVLATAGNAQATIAFTAPASNGGSAITGYTVTSSPGGFTGTGSASPITVTGLTNGTAYTFTVIATNANGNSSPSSASNSVTPSTVPGAPTIGTATAGNAQATVTFTAPASNGGSAITGYTVTSNPGNFTGTGTASPITVTGLTNGTAYTFTVIATNANGNSLPSSASNSVTPSAVPGAPTIGTATKGNAQATVTFTAPVNNGGSAITGYTVTSTPGNITGTGTVSPIIVTGLTNGTAYTFTVIATNANGNSLPSSASNSVTPSGVPGAPTIGTATEGDTQASVTFTTPVSDGGSAITGYTVTSNPGNIHGTGTVSPIIVTGLTNGTAYTFTVIATNAIGNSLPSSASNSVTPHGLTAIVDIDGNVYNIVTIGTQVWMAENLRTTKYNEGTAITPITGTGSEGAWAALTTAAYCDYNNDPANSLVYGKLYNWFVVASTNPLNVCPTGWRVPTDLDFNALATQLGGLTAAGVPMKATTLWASSITPGTNTSGFTGLPGGFRTELGAPASLTLTGPYWTSNQNLSQSTEGIGYGLHYNDAALTRAGFVKQIGCGIRCVK